MLPVNFRSLKYVPDPAQYTQLLTQLDNYLLETLHSLLEHDLSDQANQSSPEDKEFEMAIQRLDGGIPLYYTVKGTDTIGELLRSFAEHEGVPLDEVRFMEVKPDVIYHDEKIAGESRRLAPERDADPLSTYQGGTLLAYPYDGVNSTGGYTQRRLNWKENPRWSIRVPYYAGQTQVMGEVYAVSTPGVTTIGDFKRKVWVMLELPLSEQVIVDANRNIQRDDKKIHDGIMVLTQGHIVGVSGPQLNTIVYISVRDDGASIMNKVMRIYAVDMDITAVYLRIPGQPGQQNITNESRILYHYLIPNPTAYLYVDAVPSE